MPSLLLAERAENEIRKDFTPSERVAIGRAIEEELGNRQGQRTDLKAQGDDILPENFPDVQGKETRQLAAERAGFGNETTYRQAKTVVDNAEPELIEAMDRGEVAISEAAKLAKADPETQSPLLAPAGLSQAADPIAHDLCEHRLALDRAAEHAASTIGGRTDMQAMPDRWRLSSRNVSTCRCQRQRVLAAGGEGEDRRLPIVVLWQAIPCHNFGAQLWQNCGTTKSGLGTNRLSR